MFLGKGVRPVPLPRKRTNIPPSDDEIYTEVEDYPPETMSNCDDNETTCYSCIGEQDLPRSQSDPKLLDHSHSLQQTALFGRSRSTVSVGSEESIYENESDLDVAQHTMGILPSSDGYEYMKPSTQPKQFPERQQKNSNRTEYTSEQPNTRTGKLKVFTLILVHICNEMLMLNNICEVYRV